MKNIVIFGLSSWYHKRKDLYNSRYNIIAVTDNKDKSNEYDNYIKPTNLKSIQYDKIIITSTFYMEIINQLVNELEIDISKIEMATELYELDKVSYAQCSEDLIIVGILKLFRIDINSIFYLEIGANQPINLSNSYYFYKHGASGVLVEANSRLISGLNFVRPRDIIINKAIVADRAENVKFYISNVDTMSTTDYEAFINEKKSGIYPTNMEIVEEIVMPALNINDLLRTVKRDIDIFSIDIEGSDFDVIQAIDFDTYRPKFVILEKRDLEKQFSNYMDSVGYKFILSTAVNSIFIDNNFLITTYMVEGEESGQA